jgi:hypothetical protein
MAAQRLTQPRSLSRLEWWEWVEILGAVGLTGRRGGGRGRDTMGDKDVEAKGVV